jgi:hypothetical protein
MEFELVVLETHASLLTYTSAYQFATFLQLFSYAAIVCNRFTAIVFPVAHYSVRSSIAIGKRQLSRPGFVSERIGKIRCVDWRANVRDVVTGAGRCSG